jgi:Family of unknown function (DUF6011)
METGDDAPPSTFFKDRTMFTQNLDVEKSTLLGQLADSRDRLESFRATMADFFAHQTEGKQYKRQPTHLGLRLPLSGEPKGLLVVKPSWNRREKGLQADTIEVEILVEDGFTDDLWRVGRFRPTAVKLQLEAGEAKPTRWSRSCGPALDRLGSIIVDLQTDAATTLAGDLVCERCRNCGRTLTDGHSMMRGYGPECARHMAYLISLFQRVAAGA